MSPLVRRTIGLGAPLAALGIAAACNNGGNDTFITGSGSRPNLDSDFTVTPACASPGERIELVLPGACKGTLEHPYVVHFEGTAGGKLAANAIQEDRGDTCHLLVTVPPDATTGALTIDGPDGVNKDGRQAYAIPCPPDAGADADSGTAPPPLDYGGAIVVSGSSTSTDAFFFATFFKAGSPSALAAERAVQIDRVAPPAIAKGTCAAASSGGPPPALDGANVGTLNMLVNGATAATAQPQTNGTSTQYQGTLPNAPAPGDVTPKLDGDPANAKTFAPMHLPAPISVTSPDVTSGVTVTSGSGFTLQYAATGTTNLLLELFHPPMVMRCVLDPAAGSFAVPASALPSPGLWSAQLTSGNVASDELGGREVLGVATQTVQFSVQVQ